MPAAYKMRIHLLCFACNLHENERKKLFLPIEI